MSSACSTRWIGQPHCKRTWTRLKEQKYEQAYQPYLVFYRVTEPHRPHEVASDAAKARVERFDFEFPKYEVWALGRREQGSQAVA